MRNRVLFLSALIVVPIYVFLLVFFEWNSLSQTLIPVSQQMAQYISLGDEIGIQRAANSLLLLPQAIAVRVYLADGTCATSAQAEGVGNKHWESEIKDPCGMETKALGFLIKRSLTAQGIGEVGRIEMLIAPPWKYIILTPIILLLAILIASLIFKNSVQKLILHLVGLIESLPLMFKKEGSLNFDLIEIDQVYNELQRLRQQEVKLAAANTFNETATQVSHDIRSPLAALEMLYGVIKDVPEDKRVILRNSVNRIKDIANSLLTKKTIFDVNDDYLKNELDAGEASKSKFSEEKIVNTLLAPLIESIISEKRLLYRDRMNVEIDFYQSPESFGLFARVQPNELKRIISNLVNNSVEAFDARGGIVTVILDLYKESRVEVSVKDNGKGIPAELISKLGERGMTHEKEGGTGLGLYHAVETVKSWSGALEIESEMGNGTQVTMFLFNEEPAKWFVPKLVLHPDMKVIAFDDDHSFHQVWKGRLELAKAIESGIELLHFTSPNEFKNFYGRNFADLTGALFLMDFEIIGHAESGLDLIEELGIQGEAILVTSRYEEPTIRNRCEKLNVKLIPKSMSGFVPIEIAKNVK
jgi:signal transduction histidine kinase